MVSSERVTRSAIAFLWGIAAAICSAQTGILVFHKGGDVWSMNPDGTNQTRQTTGGATNGHVSNGTLVFKRSGQLYRKNLDPSSSPAAIPNTAGVLEFDLDPQATKLVITYTPNFNFDLFTMNIDGSGLRPINSVGLHQSQPSYGRDGYIYLVQSALGDAFSQKVYRISENGINNATLLTSYFSQVPASGGPDNRVAFLYNQPAPMLRVMNADGSGQADVPGSPAGILSRIAFDYDSDVIYYQFGSQIWRTNTDGSDRRVLADGADMNGGVDYGKTAAGPAPCTYSLSSTATLFGAAGGSGTLTIGTAAGCAWSAAADVNWIGVSGGSSGQGAASLAFSVALNTGPDSRSGSIRVAGQILTITQLAITQQGTAPETGTLAFRKGGDIWTMNTDGSGQTRQTSSGAATNGRTSNGTLVFLSGGQLFRKDLSAGSQPVPIPNASGVLDFDLDPSGAKLALTYTANSNFDLFTMNIDGTGKRVINSVGLHQSSPSYGRDGYIYLVQSIFGNAYTQKLYRIPENGSNNAALLTNYFTQIPSPGGPGNRLAFVYNQPSPMLRLMNADGSGQTDVPGSPSGIFGRIAYDYQREVVYYQLGSQIWRINTDGTNQRLLAEGADLNEGVDYGTAFDAAPVCSYSISARNLTFSSAGGAANFQIATAPTCAWSVRSDVPWITTAFPSGQGAGQVAFSVAANTAVSPRTGTLTVGGQSLTITQSGSAALFVVSRDVLNFSYRQSGAAPESQLLSVLSDSSGLAFSTSFASKTGPSGWLSVTPSTGVAPATLQVSVNAAGLGPQFYSGELTISIPGAQPPVRTVTINLTVERQDGRPPSLSVDSPALSFSLSRGGSSGSGRIAVGNTGQGSLEFQVSVSTTSGGGWLRVATQSGLAAFEAPATVVVQADPAGLSSGTYTGVVTVTTPVSSALTKAITVPVTMIVNDAAQKLVLSQTGMSFTAVISGGSVQPQSFGVLNDARQGTMSWTAQASTPGQRVTWLSVSPSSGVTDAAAQTIPFVTVNVDPSGLVPGTYSGQIRVNAPGALDSEQYVSVVLQVLAPGSDAGPLVRPTGLVFIGPAGGANPAGQTVAISTVGLQRRFNSGFLPLDPGAAWAAISPSNGAIAPAAPTRISVSVNTAGLPAGIRRGTITYVFEGSQPQVVEVLLVLTASGGGPAATRSAVGCTPKSLEVVSTLLSGSFNVSAGWPVPLEARVVDDCGDPLIAGSVTASFNNGDPPLPMVSLKDGRWTRTWSPKDLRVSDLTVTLTAEAQISGAATLRGNTLVRGSLNTNVTLPVINAGGVVSTASPRQKLSLAPGSLVSIFGSKLADGIGSAAGAPWDTSLGGTKAILGGFELPLAYTSEGQIKAIVPYDVPVPGYYSLTVTRGTAYAVPENIAVAMAQPAIFSADESGSGQGLIYVTADNRLAADNRPAHAGDRIAIYCTGLGAVSPAVHAGSAAPDSPPSLLTNPIEVTIGGSRAEVTFAGLAPGTVGQYRVDAIVPDGVSGVAEVVVTVAGQPSPAVTMAVQ